MYMARILASHYPCRISNMSTHMLWNSCNKLGQVFKYQVEAEFKMHSFLSKRLVP